MYTHKQAFTCVHVRDCIPLSASWLVHTVQVRGTLPMGVVERKTAHRYVSDGQDLGHFGSRCDSTLLRNATPLSTARSAGETGFLAPGVKPEKQGRKTWPQVKTTKYKEVSCH